MPTMGSFASFATRGLNRAAANFNLRLAVHALPAFTSFKGISHSRYSLDQLGYRPTGLSGTVLFFGDVPLCQQLADLHRQGHPTVFVMRSMAGIPGLLSADEASLCAIVRRLHRHGHRRIAYVRGSPDNPTANERFRGYCRGLEESGLPFDPALVFLGNFDLHMSRVETAKAIRQGIDFTALLAGNDQSAFGALRACKDLRVEVPEQVELIGLDNLHASAVTDPPLSTFELPLEEMAYGALAHIAAKLRGETVPEKTYFLPRFIQRASTRFTDHDPELDRPASSPVAAATTAPSLVRLLETACWNAPLPEFLGSLEPVVAEAIRLGLDLDELVATVLARACPASDMAATQDEHARTLSAALTLMLATARVSRSKAAEHAETFTAMSLRVRELRVEKVREDVVISVLQEALGALDFKEARFWLKDAAFTDPNSQHGTLHSWNFQTGVFSHARLKQDAVSAAELELSSRHAAILIVPLISNTEVIGHLATDGSSRFSDNLEELVRHIAGALTSVRLYGELAASNDRLRETQRELIEVSRRAGIAEVAVGVLHNIGNGLNSVNTSAGVISSHLQNLKLESVGRLEQLLVGENESWSDAFRSDPRGIKVVTFIRTLNEHLRDNRAALQKELQSLRDGVNHVNQIVAAQQSFAQVSGLPEDQNPSEPLEYALRLCETELLRHHISVIREYTPVPNVRMERHKAVQILVNLIRNAKESLSRSDQPDKQLRVGVRLNADGHAQCFVADNGGGIAADNLQRLFTMGFTTKEGGHGFGLHNSALTAQSMGGSLSAHSEGVGRGATFVFTLPQSAAAPS